jgi:arginyl-tRNA synthetase
MMLPVHDRVRQSLRETLAHLYGIDASSLPPLAIETPPSRALGDLALPLAFDLARRLRKAPRAIAQELVGACGPIEGVARVDAAPNGYLNIFLDREAFLRGRLTEPEHVVAGVSTIPHAKTIIEHTSINPNKAAHIGHLRNAALGDTLGRLLQFLDVPIEIHNYIDDTGVQVADVVVGFRELEGRALDDVRTIADTTRFDYYCWDLYARVTEWYAADKQRLAVRARTLHAIEHGGNDEARMGAFIAERIVRAHLETMRRLDIDYNLLTWEGDILRLKFWVAAFETLKASGTVYFQENGRLAGCWVMAIDDDESASADDANDEGDAREKVIVRSDGTVTYVGKDIAYQFWKFGLLGRDFYYHPFATRADGGTIWATSSTPPPDGPPAPPFGRASVSYNVIDTRQTYLQKLLKQALSTMGHTAEAERTIHFAYEMVALTHKTARELGYDDGEESGKPFVGVSGRKGLGVKADDLIDRLVQKAGEEVERRNRDVAEHERQQTAEAIAVAALRYFMVKFSRAKVIAFDIDEALSFEGESGPYLQYAVVRANNILNKLHERHGLAGDAILHALATTPATALASGSDGDELWDLVLACARLDEVVEQAVRTLEPSVVAKYAFGLAQTFNTLYHKYPVINEERADVRLWRAAVVEYFRRQLTRALELMGATVPGRM